MNIEHGPAPQEQNKNENIYIKNRDLFREHSTELQKNIEEIQSAKYGTSLLRLMERTNNNTELINNLNEFLNALEHQSYFGKSDEQLGKGRQNDLTDFLEEATKALRWTVGGGGRPADIKVDLSRWELNK